MELHEQIISKTEINTRAVKALLAIIANGLVASKTDLAECLGAKPSKFSEILNYRMRVGVDMIAKICDWYHVDPDWLLMGRGNKIFRNMDHAKPYFIEDDNNLDRQYHLTKEEDKTTDNTNSNPISPNDKGSMVDMFYQKTLEQAETIGQLKARIKELELRLEKDATNANTGGIANVG